QPTGPIQPSLVGVEAHKLLQATQFFARRGDQVLVADCQDAMGDNPREVPQPGNHLGGPENAKVLNWDRVVVVDVNVEAFWTEGIKVRRELDSFWSDGRLIRINPEPPPKLSCDYGQTESVVTAH